MKIALAVAFFGLMSISCVKDECEESPCNSYVTMELDPVCGCNGVTYPNPSTAECHGIYTYTKGECDDM